MSGGHGGLFIASLFGLDKKRDAQIVRHCLPRTFPLVSGSAKCGSGEGDTNYNNLTPPNGGSTRGAGAALARPKGVLIEHRIAVAAPAAVVWELISDLPGWSQWNPLYRRTSGSLKVDETISMTVSIPGTGPIDLRCTVMAVVTNELLHYQGTALGGLLRGTRYIEIESTGAEDCLVLNVEIVGGLLGPLMARAAQDRIHISLEVMSEALKTVAEARWQARSAPAFSRDIRQA